MKNFNIRCFFGFHKLKTAGNLDFLDTDGNKISFSVCQKCGKIILPPLDVTLKLNWNVTPPDNIKK